MNRSIETRLKRLETVLVPEKLTRGSHIFAAASTAEADAKIAELVANGTADPDDLFIQLVPFSAYRWDEAAARWVKDGHPASPAEVIGPSDLSEPKLTTLQEAGS